MHCTDQEMGMQTDKVTNLRKWFKERGIEYEGIRIISDRYTKYPLVLKTDT